MFIKTFMLFLLTIPDCHNIYMDRERERKKEREREREKDFIDWHLCDWLVKQPIQKLEIVPVNLKVRIAELTGKH